MRLGQIVGWHRGDTGTQVCRECQPEKPRDAYPIKHGDPDWGLDCPGWGSVPVCSSCRREIPTVPDPAP